jgi:hypothetical protein
MTASGRTIRQKSANTGHRRCRNDRPEAVACGYASSVNAIVEPDHQAAQIFNDGGDAILFAKRIDVRGLL